MSPRACCLLGLLTLSAPACGEERPAEPVVQLPPGDPDGGSVSGIITTNLTSTAGGHLFIGALEPDGGLVAAVGYGETVFPVSYQLDAIPSGQREIRALLDFPPYASRPLAVPAGSEDATGVFLNECSVLPVDVRPGITTSKVSLFVTR